MTVQCSMHGSEFASLCLLMCRSLIPLKDSFSKYFNMYLPLKCIGPSGCCCCSLSQRPNACICLGLRLCLFFSCTCSTHSTQTAAYSRLQIKRILSLLFYIVVFSLVICSLQFILFAYSFSLECSASMLRLICALYTILYDVIVIVVVVVFGFMRSFISDCLGSFASCNFTTPYTNFFFSTSFFKFKSI